MFDAPLALTVLHSRGRRLAKLIDGDNNISSYDAARTFDMTERTFADLDDLHVLLCELSERRDCCAVRGGIADRARTRAVRRLLHADGDDAKTLIDVPRAWLALDIDGLSVPDYIDRHSIFQCAVTAINALPPAFRGAGFVAMATGSHGVKPGAHLRLWCVLARAIDGADASRWIAAIRKTLAALDPASARPAQIIYAAAPVFESADDPIKTRIELLRGGPVPVPEPAELAPPAPPPPRPLPRIDDRHRRYAAAACRRAAEKIALAPEGSRHAEIVAEARSLFRLARRGVLAETEIHDLITGAAHLAGKADAAEIKNALHWAASHAGGGGAQ